MTLKLHESATRVHVGVIEKLASACYFKIARETILLLVDNIKGNIRDKNTRNATLATYIAISPLHFFLKKV